MKKVPLAAALAIALAALPAAAPAQAKPDVLVKQRQAGMTLLGKYFGPLAGMAKGAAPYDAAVVQRNAAYLETLAKLPWDGFAESTKGEKSAALPAVFTDAARFKQAQEQLTGAVAGLSASKGGDEAKVKAAIGAVGKACAACHDAFRQM